MQTARKGGLVHVGLEVNSLIHTARRVRVFCRSRFQLQALADVNFIVHCIFINVATCKLGFES